MVPFRLIPYRHEADQSRNWLDHSSHDQPTTSVCVCVCVGGGGGGGCVIENMCTSDQSCMCVGVSVHVGVCKCTRYDDSSLVSAHFF